MSLFELLVKSVKLYFQHRRLSRKLRSKPSPAAHEAIMESYKRGDYEAALKSATAVDDDFFKGSTLLQLGRLEQARKCLEQAINGQAHAQLAAIAHVELGHLLLHQENYDRALNEFLLAQRLWPGRAATHRDIAEVWLCRGEKVQEALQHARLAVEKERADPGLSPEIKKINLSENLATLAWAVAVHSGDAAEVPILTAEAIGLCDGSPVSSIAQMYYQCAMAAAAIGNSAQSEQYFQRASEVDPHGIWGRTAQGMIAGVRN
jgi:tetratricopeptide (TPR) repeat protein